MMDKRLLRLVPEALAHIRATVLWQLADLIGTIAFTASLVQLFALLLSWPQSNNDTQYALIMLLVLLCALCVKVVAVNRAGAEAFSASQDVKLKLRRRIYEKLLALGQNYDQHISTSELVQLSVEGCEQLESYFGQYLPQLIYALIAPLVLFVVVAPLNLAAAIVLLLCVPLIPVLIVAIQKIAKKILGRYWGQYAELGHSFLENLQGLTTLKVFHADELRHQKMNEQAERFRIATMKVLAMQLNSIIVMDFVALGGAVAGIATALVLAHYTMIDAMRCLFIALISAEFFLPMRRLGSYFHIAMNGIAASQKIFELLELPEEGERSLHIEPGDHFYLRELSFGYNEYSDVLHNVTLDIPSVGLTAIVGASGSGKSTIAQLLCGRYSNYQGNLLLGGKETRDINRRDLRRFVTLLPLGSTLFSTTIRENLLMGAYAQAGREPSDAELWEALDAARLGDFVRSQPEGLEYRLSEAGANLSGGQRQRLCFARTLLSGAQVFVLDEATSNIDVESEQTILETVEKLARTHAVVLISHRLANVVNAQCIYVLEQGRVLGAGRHDELLDSCACYQNLWCEQMELEAIRGNNAGKERSHD